MITTGLGDFLGRLASYRKRNIALIANQTSVTEDLSYSWEVFARSGLRLRTVFSPEHGLFGTEQDQVAVRERPAGGVEVVSLYGPSYESLAPLGKHLEGIDLVLFDIQDVGSRYYTFVNSMALFMKAVSGMGIEFMVLDRPNPIGGLRVEGPALREGFESFVGIFHGPVRHGLTPGELAGIYRSEHDLDLPLAVMKMSGWRREMSYRATGLPWVPPSPNMPAEETALVYPGMCLLEGTNLSEGRGTATPFQAAGAPFVASEEFAERLNRQGLAGVRFRPIYFRPAFHKFAGEVCGGAFVHITDPGAFRPFLTGVAFVKTAGDLYPDEFRFLRGVYEFNDRHPAFDLLAGGPTVREMILAGASLREIAASWEEEEREYRERKAEYHIYD